MKIYNVDLNTKAFIENNTRRVTEIEQTTISNQHMSLKKEDKRKKEIKKQPDKSVFHEQLTEKMHDLGMSYEKIDHVLKKTR